MLQLDDFVIDLKRVNQYGDESVTNDSPTTDIIRWLNRYMRAVAKMTAWSWLIKSFDVTVVAGVQLITIDSTIKKIVAINNGTGGYLKKISIKQALTWNTPTTTGTDTNVLGYYVDMGVNVTTGARIIKVYGNPGSSTTLTAYGTRTWTPFTIASIGTSANFLPFPDEIMDSISDLISARIQKLKGASDWAVQEKVAWDSLRIAMGEEQSDPSDDATAPLPDYYLRQKYGRWHK